MSEAILSFLLRLSFHIDRKIPSDLGGEENAFDIGQSVNRPLSMACPMLALRFYSAQVIMGGR